MKQNTGLRLLFTHLVTTLYYTAPLIGSLLIPDAHPGGERAQPCTDPLISCTDPLISRTDPLNEYVSNANQG